DHVDRKDRLLAILGRMKREEFELWNVHEDGRVLELRRQPAEALERELDLSRTSGEWHRERPERPLAQNAVALESMTSLESRDGGAQRLVDELFVGGDAPRLRQIAERDEQAPQLRCAGIARTGSKRPLRQTRQWCGEPGVGRELPVARQCLL